MVRKDASGLYSHFHALLMWSRRELCNLPEHRRIQHKGKSGDGGLYPLGLTHRVKKKRKRKYVSCHGGGVEEVI